MAADVERAGDGARWRDAVQSWRISETDAVPIYHQIRTALADLVAQGVWKPGDQIPGERDLARHFGVSTLTVNKAVQGLVRDEILTRERGRGTFVANPQRGRTARFAIVTLKVADNCWDYYFSSLVAGIQAALLPLGLDHSITFLEDCNAQVADGLAHRRIRGLLFIAPHESRWPEIERLHAQGTPCVVVGGSWEGARVPCVDSDNVGGATAAMQHLLALGHRRIGTIQGALSQPNHRDRLRVYHQMMARHNLPVRPDWVVDGWFPREPVDAVRRMLTSPDRPTAVFAVGYFPAISTIQIAKEIGLRVPEDLSVVGFDDPSSAAYFDPPLTTVRQPLEEMGQVAMEMLIALAVQGAPAMASRVLSTELIERRSCARVPGSGA